MYPVVPDQESTVANSKAEADSKPPHIHHRELSRKEGYTQQDVTEQDHTHAVLCWRKHC